MSNQTINEVSEILEYIIRTIKSALDREQVSPILL